MTLMSRGETPDTQRPTSPRGTSYIRPQQGLALRKSGGVMQVNLENIGGRILVLAERNTHKNRMKTIKSVVDVQPPWGYELLKPKPRRPPSRPGFNRPAKDSHSARNTSGRTDNLYSPAYAASPPAVAARPVGGGETTETQVLVEAVVAMLSTKEPSEAKRIVRDLLREADERRLLCGYTGVFPDLDDDCAADAAAQPTKPVQQPSAPKPGRAKGDAGSHDEDADNNSGGGGGSSSSSSSGGGSARSNVEAPRKASEASRSHNGSAGSDRTAAAEEKKPAASVASSPTSFY
ncbi:hypothetical protein DIPPA_02619 [Diplonema papillatum]|nr:hypothetical protein DIPPA_02619 [Diplonema papillatum]|eukprot:gene22891-35086_t